MSKVKFLGQVRWWLFHKCLELRQIDGRIKLIYLCTVRSLALNIYGHCLTKIYFHCNFFLSLLTTPNSFFFDGVRDSEMYTFLSLSVASEEILEDFAASDFLSISIEIISDASTGKLYDHFVVFTFVKRW